MKINQTERLAKQSHQIVCAFWADEFPHWNAHMQKAGGRWQESVERTEN